MIFKCQLLYNYRAEYFCLPISNHCLQLLTGLHQGCPTGTPRSWLGIGGIIPMLPAIQSPSKTEWPLAEMYALQCLWQSWLCSMTRATTNGPHIIHSGSHLACPTAQASFIPDVETLMQILPISSWGSVFCCASCKLLLQYPTSVLTVAWLFFSFGLSLQFSFSFPSTNLEYFFLLTLFLLQHENLHFYFQISNHNACLWSSSDLRNHHALLLNPLLTIWVQQPSALPDSIFHNHSTKQVALISL